MFDDQVLTWGEKIEARGRVLQLIECARVRFGASVANAMEASLGPSVPETALEDLTEWVVQSSSGDALLAKLRRV